MFGRYLIAAFHPRPIFANDERLQDPELASKTRFPYYRYRNASVSELIRRSFWNIQFFSTQILQNLDFELAACRKSPENLRSVHPKLIQIWCQRCTSRVMNLERKLKQQKCLGFTKINIQL